MDTNENSIMVYICDDNQEEMEELRNTLSALSEDISNEIKLFQSSEEMMTQLELIQEKKEKVPELLLLDIEMPKENGIQIGKKIKEMMPGICLVFVTAYVEYAIQGYEANAFRYLLKPISEETLRRLFSEMKIESDKNKLSIKTRKGEEKVLLRDVLYISAEDKYTVIYTKEEHYVSNICLTEYEAQLERKGFFRIHRKYLLNLYHQKGIENGHILLTDGKTLPISKKRRKPYQDYLFQCMKEKLL